VFATVPEVGEPLDEQVCEELAAIARRQGILLVAGVVETSDERGSAYNTPAACGPYGGGLFSCWKIYLFDAPGFRE
jgi:predicted amidohydrolase